jgi:hypothetical protein
VGSQIPAKDIVIGDKFIIKSQQDLLLLDLYLTILPPSIYRECQKDTSNNRRRFYGNAFPRDDLRIFDDMFACLLTSASGQQSLVIIVAHDRPLLAECREKRR